MTRKIEFLKKIKKGLDKMGGNEYNVGEVKHKRTKINTAHALYYKEEKTNAKFHVVRR